MKCSNPAFLDSLIHPLPLTNHLTSRLPFCLCAFPFFSLLACVSGTPAVTLLSLSSHSPLILLSLSSHSPLTLLSFSSHSPLTLLSLSSQSPLTLTLLSLSLQATHFQSIGGVRERGVVDSLSNGKIVALYRTLLISQSLLVIIAIKDCYPE